MKAHDLISENSSPEAIIKMMTSGLKNLDIKIKHVGVEFSLHARARPKECFNNAYKYVADNFDKSPIYILGFIFYRGIPIEHAWVKDGNRHIDVTINTEDNEYFKVVEVPTDLLLAYVGEKMHAPDLQHLNRFAAGR